MASLLLLLLCAQTAAQPDVPPLDAGLPPPPRIIHVHLAGLESSSPAARAVSPEVFGQAVVLGKSRPQLFISETPPAVWNDPTRLKHQGALLKCLDPWFARKQVFQCLDAMAWPPPPEPLPKGVNYVITGMLYASDQGIMLDTMLQPVVDGEPGVSIASRSVLLPPRKKRKERTRSIAQAFLPLFDAAAGVPGR